MASSRSLLRRALPLTVAVSLVVPAVLAPAGADSISDKRRQASLVAKKLDQMENQVESLQEDYLQAQVDLADLGAQVADAKAEVARTATRIGAVRGRMGSYVVRAYVDGSQVDPLFGGTGDATALVSRQGYTSVALGQDRSLDDDLSAARQDQQRAKNLLAARLQKQQQLQQRVSGAKKAAETAAAKLSQQLKQVKGELAVLVKQEQDRIAAEQARLAAAQAAARAAAARRTQQGSTGSRGGRTGTGTGSKGSGSGGVGRTIPPPSPGAAGAVAAARSQLGVPYHWATMSPGVGFDCSGLTAWAWGRAGRALPHSSRAQYAATTHVPVDEVQPGDLVFFGSPIHHVGLYIGGGQMVDAPRTGEVVRIASIYRSDLVSYAGRP